MTVSFGGSENKLSFGSLDNFLIEDENAFKLLNYFLKKENFSLLEAFNVLSYPNIPVALLELFFEKWPEERQYMLTSLVDNRTYYSDELLRYITSFNYPNVWTTLFNLVSEGKIPFGQINILWEREELYRKHRLIMHVIYNDNKVTIPEYMWVEYYVYINDEEYANKYSSHSKSIVEHLGGIEQLRLFFINYIKSYDDSVSGFDFLPFEWLMELAKTNITITGK